MQAVAVLWHLTVSAPLCSVTLSRIPGPGVNKHPPVRLSLWCSHSHEPVFVLSWLLTRPEPCSPVSTLLGSHPEPVDDMLLCVARYNVMGGTSHTPICRELKKSMLIDSKKIGFRYLSFWIGTSPELHVFLSSCNSLDRVMCNVECVTYYQFLIWNRWPIETLRLPPLIMLLLRITAVSGDNAEEKHSLELEFCVWEVSTTHPDQ